MKINYFPLILIIIFLIPHPQVSALEGNVYEETIVSYSRINGETFRSDMDNSFIINDFVYSQRVVNNQSEKIVTAEVLHDSQRGQVEELIEPLKGANFGLTVILNELGNPIEYSWEIFLFRDVNHPNINSNPEDGTIRSAYSRNEHEQFDLKSSQTFFSVNLQHYEYQVIDGKEIKLKVNTDISTKNYDNGRIEKSAIHMIKRNSNQDIVYEYNHEIQEKSVLQRYLNLLDQPKLLIPFQFAAVMALLLIYIYSHRYISSRGIKIVKTFGKKIELVDVDDASIESTDGTIDE